MSGVGYRGEGCGDNRSMNSLPKPESRPSAGRVPYRDKSTGVRGDGFQHSAIVLAQSTLCWGCSFRRETGKVGSVAPARRRGIRTPRRVGASPTGARYRSPAGRCDCFTFRPLAVAPAGGTDPWMGQLQSRGCPIHVSHNQREGAL